MLTDRDYLRIAAELAEEGVRKGEGGPFGAIIVYNGEIIGKGNNKVLLLNDPTAHAEVVAIRNACKKLNKFHLPGSVIYTTCEPCPMCLGAIYWTHIDRIVFSATRKDAANIGFDDNFIYEEICLPYHKRKLKIEQVREPLSLHLFKIWSDKEDKTMY